MCSTTITIRLVKHLGYLTDGMLSGLSFPELNSLSDSLLDVFNSPELRSLELDYHRSFLDFAEAYIRGDVMEGPLAEFKIRESEYFSGRGELFRRAVNPDFLDYLGRLLS
jgi:hypothetical protein